MGFPHFRMLAMAAAAVLATALAGCQEEKAAEAAPAKSASAKGTQTEAKPAPPADGGQTIEEMRADSLARLDRKACEEKGGSVRQEGMLGLWRCTLPYADAGKVCRDGDDCLGHCIAEEITSSVGEGAPPTTGFCQKTDSPFGCYALVEDGVADGMRCVD